MGLLSIFKRDRLEASTPSEAALTVQQARTRARRRLTGASLLVLMGIVGFPLLFESQPRPIAVDIPIDIPRSEGAPALKIPPARSQVIEVESPVLASPKAKPARTEPVDAEEPMDAAPTKATAASAVKPSVPAQADTAAPDKVPPRVASPPAPAPAPAVESKSASASEPRPAAKSAADSTRAQALLEGRDSKKASVSAGTDRFVVQVGAFADSAAAKEVRQKVEKLGLKTYTQVVETPSGSRTRVRVGPLESKEQATKVAERLKAAGLSAAVLTL